MSDQYISDTQQPITEDKVAEYLRRDPEFFSRRPELLLDLVLPHASGKAVSLVEKQVSVLRERNIDMRNRLSNLLENARDNDRLFDKTKRLVLALIECHELGDMVDALYYSFSKEFNVHYTRLILFSSSAINVGAARVDTLEQARQHLGRRLKPGYIMSGGMDADETRFIFDDDAPNIGSAAISILAHGNPLGILAIGNQDPHYYHSSMGTLFLAYIGEVLNRLLPKYLP